MLQQQQEQQHQWSASLGARSQWDFESLAIIVWSRPIGISVSYQLSHPSRTRVATVWTVHTEELHAHMYTVQISRAMQTDKWLRETHARVVKIELMAASSQMLQNPN